MLDLNHKDMEVWKKSMDLIKEIYQLTEKFPEEERFGLTNQLKRASVSVTFNISEGASRSSSLERKRFYEIARSSLVEIDTQIEIAKALRFVSDMQLKKISGLMNELFAMLTVMKANT